MLIGQKKAPQQTYLFRTRRFDFTLVCLPPGPRLMGWTLNGGEREVWNIVGTGQARLQDLSARWI